MAVQTITRTVGTTGHFSTPQLWEDGAPANLTTAEKSAANTFLVAAFIQGEVLNFVGSGATGKFLDSDSTGAGNGTYVTYGRVTGNPAANDVITGATSGATCVNTSGTPTDTGVIWRGEQQNQEFSGAGTQLNFGGSTADATRYKEYTTVAGASFMDHADRLTNPLRYDAAKGAAIKNTNNATVIISQSIGTRLSKLQISNPNATGNCLQTQQTGEFEFLLLDGKYVATSATSGIVSITGVVSPNFRNCLIVQRASAADHIIGTGTGSPNFYNCTIVASDNHAAAPTSIFLSGASGTVTAQNCGLFAGDSTKALKAGSATFNFTTCYSDISGTSGVTQTTYTNEFQNVNDATLDFRLKGGSAQIDTGTTDATNAATDIVGTARPQSAAYDVGCWELVSTGTGALASQASTASGSGTSKSTGTGALTAQAAQVSGTGTVTSVVLGSGALTAQSAQVSGVGQVSGHEQIGPYANEQPLPRPRLVPISGYGYLRAGNCAVLGDGRTHWEKQNDEVLLLMAA